MLLLFAGSDLIGDVEPVFFARVCGVGRLFSLRLFFRPANKSSSLSERTSTVVSRTLCLLSSLREIEEPGAVGQVGWRGWYSEGAGSASVV